MTGAGARIHDDKREWATFQSWIDSEPYKRTSGRFAGLRACLKIALAFGLLLRDLHRAQTEWMEPEVPMVTLDDHLRTTLLKPMPTIQTYLLPKCQVFHAYLLTQILEDDLEDVPPPPRATVVKKRSIADHLEDNQVKPAEDPVKVKAVSGRVERASKKAKTDTSAMKESKDDDVAPALPKVTKPAQGRKGKAQPAVMNETAGASGSGAVHTGRPKRQVKAPVRFDP